VDELKGVLEREVRELAGSVLGGSVKYSPA
jgi:hypothetical protein